MYKKLVTKCGECPYMRTLLCDDGPFDITYCSATGDTPSVRTDIIHPECPFDEKVKGV